MRINSMYNMLYIVGFLGKWMVLMDMGLPAPMVAIRVVVEVRDLRHQVGLVMGINLMYDMSI